MKNNSGEAKISVIVPVYNSERTLNRCLGALKNQTDSNYEVVVVDDSSSDNSPEICKQFGFKVVTLAANKGQAVARNEGVKKSSGEIIAFVDSDAETPSDWLQKYRHLLTKYKDADMICSGYSGNIGNSQPALFALHESSYRRLGIPLYIESTTSSNCVIYKRVFKEVCGYPEYYINAKKDPRKQKAVSTNEDAELGFLLSERKKKIVWSHDNPVKHHFKDSWKGYLRQQIGFSRYAVLSIFKFPRMLFSKGIYSGKKVMTQVSVALIMLLAILGLFFGKISALITVFIEISAILFFYIFNRNFMYYLKSNMENYSFTRLFFWLIISRFCLLYGICLGLGGGCRMLWNSNFVKN